ncbi:hypothetical protein [uncultured Akkermansia sp.]|uniref:hypothetical protein n=1 Tax=uncultured Akkermansia sp. TaxID=512294 RepID=UPI0026069217|nr:hypothetical protein [uncultured Akkermansia sp.]
MKRDALAFVKRRPLSRLRLFHGPRQEESAIRGRQNIVIVLTIARQSEGDASRALRGKRPPPYFLDDFRYY